jgi:hypothetical protein
MGKQRFDWRFAQAWELYERIPMKGISVLPDEGFAPRTVNIARRGSPDQPRPPIYMPVRCRPKPQPGKRWGHRLLVQCDCGQEVPIGRMVSHAPACPKFQALYPAS